MNLYHGTSEKASKQIVLEGLKPRGDAQGRWFTNGAVGHHNRVYLTSCKSRSFFYAVRAAIMDDCKEGAIIEIDIKGQEKQIYADENLRIARAPNLTGTEYKTFVAKTTKDRRWRKSLKETTLCAHEGALPVTALVKVGHFEVRKSVWWHPQFDLTTDPTTRAKMFDWLLHLEKQPEHQALGAHTAERWQKFDLIKLGKISYQPSWLAALRMK